MKRFLRLVLVAVLILAMALPVLADKNDKIKEPNINKPIPRKEFNTLISSLLEEYGYYWKPVEGNNNITREEIVMVIGKLLIDEDIIDSSSVELPFKDIKNVDKKVKDNLRALYNENIINGKTKNTFNPNSKVTYGELNMILERVRKVLEWKKDKDYKNTIPFKVKISLNQDKVKKE